MSRVQQEKEDWMQYLVVPEGLRTQVTSLSQPKVINPAKFYRCSSRS